MLTIKAPIELKTANQIAGNSEAFCQRIRGSYQLIPAHLEQEDLLHIMTVPQEYYYSEGNMTTLITQNTQLVSVEEKIELINNAMNRILASADVHLTYQDRSFITDVLYKLGIRDDRRFMEQIRQMTEETKNTNELINLYWLYGEEYRELLEQTEQNLRQENQTTEVSESTENRLYTQIFHRLQTGAVYQIVQNFQKSLSTERIQTNELRNSEQSYLASQILLERLREASGGPEMSLIYRSENVYEQDSLYQSETDTTQVRQNINSAVLLEALKNVYHVSFDHFTDQAAHFYDLRSSFYHMADNVLMRMESRTNEILQEQSLSYRQDLTYLREGDRTTETNVTVQAAETPEEAPQKPKRGRKKKAEAEVITEKEREITERPVVTEEVSRYISNLARTFLQNSRSEETSQTTYEGDTLQLLSLLREGDLTEETSVTQQEQNLQELRQQLNEINEQNVSRQNAYVKILNDMRRTQVRRQIDQREQTRKDALRALSDPTYVAQILQQQEEIPDARERMIRAASMVLPDQQAQLVEAVEQYLGGDTNVRQQLNMTRVEPERFMSEIGSIRQEQVRETERQTTLREQGPEPALMQGPDMLTQAVLQYLEGDTTLLDQMNVTHLPPERLTEELTQIRQEQAREQQQQAPSPVRTQELVTAPGQTELTQALMQYLEGDTTLLRQMNLTNVSPEQLREELTRIRETRKAEMLRQQETRERERETLNLRNLETVRETVAPGAQAGEAAGAWQEDVQRVSRRRRRQSAKAQEPQEIPEVSMVHRREEHLTQEEIAETFEELRKNTEKKVQETTESNLQIQKTQQTVVTQQTTQQVHQRTDREIEEMIENGVRRQMGTISNEVMTRIERRLQNEKSRRGI